jgi:hypothetical protein
MTTETDTSPSDWTVETLKQFVSTTMNDMRNHAAALREADDLRYQQRFDASEKALVAASLAAKEAVAAALASAKEAVAAASVGAEKSVASAMAASEKAIEKAEAAQHAHNLVQNEWRATVNDLTQTVASNARHESEALVRALQSNTDQAFHTLNEKAAHNSQRLDRAEGRDTGTSSTIAMVIAVIGLLIGLGSGVVAYTSRSNNNTDLTSRMDALSNRLNQTTQK